MSYNSGNRKPFEFASKINHSYIINSEETKRFLKNCDFVDFDFHKHSLPIDNIIKKNNDSKIKKICAIDGSYLEVPLSKRFPSRTIGYFHMGFLIFDYLDYSCLKHDTIIDPQKLKQLEESCTFSFELPIQNIILSNQTNLLNSVRYVLHSIFSSSKYTPFQKNCLYDITEWILREEWQNKLTDEIVLEKCPICGEKICLKFEKKNYEKICGKCGNTVYLIDIFRFNEIINEVSGASGIMSYLCSIIEQFIMFDIIKDLLEESNSKIEEFIFIKDGPLAFFAQTFRLNLKVRKFISYCYKKEISLNIIGLEKSGSFVEHVALVKDKMEKEVFYIFNEDYIRKYISPKETNTIYGFNTYYGKKVAYKNISNDVVIACIPVNEYKSDNDRNDLLNPDVVLTVIGNMRCNMYDNAVVPISIVNKLVSLSYVPGKKVLEKFSKEYFK